jgi:hypothetical protein
MSASFLQEMIPTILPEHMLWYIIQFTFRTYAVWTSKLATEKTTNASGSKFVVFSNIH